MLKDRIKQEIKEISSEDVIKAVAEQYVKKELSKRVEILTKAYEKIQTLIAEQVKLNKPDTKHYTSDGKLIETYSENAWKNLDSKNKELDKIEKAFNRALEYNDYVELYNLMGTKKE